MENELSKDAWKLTLVSMSPNMRVHSMFRGRKLKDLKFLTSYVVFQANILEQIRSSLSAWRTRWLKFMGLFLFLELAFGLHYRWVRSVQLYVFDIELACSRRHIISKLVVYWVRYIFWCLNFCLLNLFKSRFSIILGSHQIRTPLHQSNIYLVDPGCWVI